MQAIINGKHQMKKREINKGQMEWHIGIGNLDRRVPNPRKPQVSALRNEHHSQLSIVLPTKSK